MTTRGSPLEQHDLPYKQKRKWKYTAKEYDYTIEIACYDCGLWYSGSAWADIVLPNELWELISPTDRQGGGLLCFNCMNRRLEFLGLEEVPFEIGSGPFACDKG